MARQRKSVQECNKADKGANSSSSNGSSSPNNETSKRINVLSYWKQIVVCIVLSIAISFGYMGYLETRVNTPFDGPKVVIKNDPYDSQQFWGSYRPGVYFGLKTRDFHSLVAGLMWYFPSRLKPGGDGIRHWCEQSDNLEKYGWIQHDGSNFGVQEIQDGPFRLNTSFVKVPGGLNGGDWSARISVKVMNDYRELVPENEEVSLIWYLALDEETKGFLAPTNSATKLTGIRGQTSKLDEFTVKIKCSQGYVNHESFLSTVAPGLHLLKETVISSLRLAQDKQSNIRKIVLAGELLPDAKQKEPNFVAIQVTGKLPFSIDVIYESHSLHGQKDALQGNAYTKALDWHLGRFHQRVESTFGLKSKGNADKDVKFAEATLSNMLGGIGYFYGPSMVQSSYTKEPVYYWPAPLFTGVPSRSFFPRGFLWDEGFHGLLISQWDVDIEIDIISHWFDLMNVEGWIPREQILGVEALAKVPKEFVVQRNTNANPPTFFLTLQSILDNYTEHLTNERLATLERLYPRLQAWFSWFNTTQKGPIPGSYRWRGRDPTTNRELNPKTLTSGLDDFPRASHPTDDERHVDLYCWIALAAETLGRLARLLGRHENAIKYEQTANYMKDNDLLLQLHWSEFTKTFADYGLHTDSVKLARPKVQPRQPNQNLEMVRIVLKHPELRLVDSVFGYVNIFPFLLGILKPDSPALDAILTQIRDPDILWSEYGLRSLSKKSLIYMQRNTEHDPPYWRGQIWININYLATKALYNYANIEGPYKDKAKKVYSELRSNLVRNIIRQYEKSGYVWEQYNDKTGEGSGCRPFTGWTALVVTLMSEKY